MYLNDKFRLFVLGDDKPLPCGVESITNDGLVVVRGLLPDTRRLFIPFSMFAIRDDDDELMVMAKVIKVNWQEVQDVVAFKPGDATTVEIVAELSCVLDKCEFFEPLVEYPGGVSQRQMPKE